MQCALLLYRNHWRFVMKAKVSHDFVDTYDSASVMVMKDLQNWGKACFEMTDFGTHAVVSSYTKKRRVG